MPDGLSVLVLAGVSSAALIGLLIGLWFGLKVAVTDSANLARFATAAEDAGKRAEEALLRMGAVEESISGLIDETERKRRQLTAAATRAERAEQQQQQPDEATVTAAPMSQSDRRRLVARRLAAGRRGAA